LKIILSLSYKFPILYQDNQKPYIPGTSSNKSAQISNIIGTIKPEHIAGSISKMKIFLSTFGTDPINNARENIIVGQGATPNNRIFG